MNLSDAFPLVSLSYELKGAYRLAENCEEACHFNFKKISCVLTFILSRFYDDFGKL